MVEIVSEDTNTNLEYLVQHDEYTTVSEQSELAGGYEVVLARQSYKKFNVHNYPDVMKILVLMRNLQDGFLNVELSEVLINIIQQKIEIVREP